MFVSEVANSECRSQRSLLKLIESLCEEAHMTRRALLYKASEGDIPSSGWNVGANAGRVQELTAYVNMVSLLPFHCHTFCSKNSHTRARIETSTVLFLVK